MRIKVSKLDILFSRFIRLKAGGICEYCGQAKKRLETSHFISRRYRATRWLELNACAVCFSCHRYLDEHPYKHTAFWEKRIGTEAVEQLHILADTIKAKIDEDALMVNLKEEIKLLNELDLSPERTGLKSKGIKG